MSAQATPFEVSEQVKLACRDCGKPFNRDGKEYNRPKGHVICKDQPTCRSRQLSAEIATELGSQKETWLFSRRPRTDIWADMDIQPANWQGEWISIRPPAMRVLAAIEYFSWCYPVCIRYAVQIDEDDVPIKKMGKWVPHTIWTLGKVLNMDHASVGRAVRWLVRRKMIRLDEETGALYREPNPQLTAEERLRVSTDTLVPNLTDLRALPPPIRRVWADLIADAPERVSTDSFALLNGLCTDFNGRLKKLRYSFHSDAKAECIRVASLLSRQVTFKERPASPPGSRNGHAMKNGAAPTPAANGVHAATHPPSVGRSFSGVVGEKRVKDLGYTRPDPQPEETDRPTNHDALQTKLRAWMEERLSVPVPLEDAEFNQVAATIHTEEHLAQFQEAALNQKQPRGWKVFVKIARKCEQHHAHYAKAKASAAGSTEEPYFERKYREEMERRKKQEGSDV